MCVEGRQYQANTLAWAMEVNGIGDIPGITGTIGTRLGDISREVVRMREQLANTERLIADLAESVLHSDAEIPPGDEAARAEGIITDWMGSAARLTRELPDVARQISLLQSKIYGFCVVTNSQIRGRALPDMQMGAQEAQLLAALGAGQRRSIPWAGMGRDQPNG